MVRAEESQWYYDIHPVGTFVEPELRSSGFSEYRSDNAERLGEDELARLLKASGGRGRQRRIHMIVLEKGPQGRAPVPHVQLPGVDTPEVRLVGPRRQAPTICTASAFLFEDFQALSRALGGPLLGASTGKFR